MKTVQENIAGSLLDFLYEKDFDIYSNLGYVLDYQEFDLEDACLSWLEDEEIAKEFPMVKEVRHGAEQLVVVCEDEVIKISDTSMVPVFDSLMERLDEDLRKFFAPVHLVGVCGGLTIVSQEKVTPNREYDKDFGEDPISTRYLPQRLISSLRKIHGLTIKDISRIDDGLRKTCYGINRAIIGQVDVNNHNWGYDKMGNVKIYDPIYCGGDSYDYYGYYSSDENSSGCNY